MAAICGPLAARVAALPHPLAARTWVDELTDAVHELTSTVTGWLAERDALAKTKHLADAPAKRQSAVTLLTSH